MDWHFHHTPKPTVLRKIKTLLYMDERLVRLRRARGPLHILLVEDDPITQRLLKAFLSMDYSIIASANAADAVNEYLRVMPDLVFLDLHLGKNEYNGLDVLYTLRTHDANAQVVMLSSDDSRDAVAQATREGAIGFVTKPFSKEQLMHYVQDCEFSKTRSFVKETRLWN